MFGTHPCEELCRIVRRQKNLHSSRCHEARYRQDFDKINKIATSPSSSVLNMVLNGSVFDTKEWFRWSNGCLYFFIIPYYCSPATSAFSITKKHLFFFKKIYWQYYWRISPAPTRLQHQKKLRNALSPSKINSTNALVEFSINLNSTNASPTRCHVAPTRCVALCRPLVDMYYAIVTLGHRLGAWGKDTQGLVMELGVGLQRLHRQ